MGKIILDRQKGKQNCCFFLDINALLFQVEAGKDFYTSSKRQMRREEWKPERRTPFSVCDLQITEAEDRISPLVKDASTSFGPTEGRMEACQTHI